MNTIVIKFKTHELRNYYEGEIEKLKIEKFSFLKLWLQVEAKESLVDFEKGVIDLRFDEDKNIKIKFDEVNKLYK